MPAGQDGGGIEQALRAIAQQGRPGLVVELGPRAGTLGRAALAAGLDYVAVCERQADLSELRRSGLRCVPHDLADLDTLYALLVSLGQIRALVVHGSLGRHPDPAGLLQRLSGYSRAHGRPPLAVVEPNAGHYEYALRLLIGERLPALDAASGLVPARPFTGRALAALLSHNGWQVTVRHDIVPDGDARLDRAAVHLDAAATDPSALPLALGPTLVGDALRAFGAVFNPDTAVSELVWLLSPIQALPATLPQPETRRPLVSILMRTQGRRHELMTEALYSILAQTCDDYEVLICFHDPDGQHAARKREVERTIAGLPDPLPERVRLIECHEPGRGSPLNALVERAEGVYASFLDDDDLLFDHHVETIRQGVAQHGSQVLFQTFASQRLLEPVRPATPPDAVPGQAPDYPYSVVAMAVPWARPLDPVVQHHENMAPICCLAVPLALVRQTRLRFRTDLEVAEEWAFWMEALQLLRVVTLPEITAAVNHWNDTASNAMLRPDLAPLWRSVRDTRHANAAATPLLLDGPARALLAEAGRQAEEVVWLRQQLKEREARLAGIQKSRLWRLARAVWWVRDRLRAPRRR